MYLDRKAWGAVPAKRITTMKPKNVKGFVLHHTVTPQVLDMKLSVRAIQRHHMAPKSQKGRNWSDIAYNFLIDNAGHLYEGRGWDRVGGANGSKIFVRPSKLALTRADFHYYSCAFLGNFEEDELSMEAVETFQRLRAKLLERLPSASALFTHQDIKATACPGSDVLGNLDLLAMMPEPEVAPVPTDTPSNSGFRLVLDAEDIAELLDSQRKTLVPLLQQIKSNVAEVERVLGTPSS